jgi:hypothetical protein
MGSELQHTNESRNMSVLPNPTPFPSLPSPRTPTLNLNTVRPNRPSYRTTASSRSFDRAVRLEPESSGSKGPPSRGSQVQPTQYQSLYENKVRVRREGKCGIICGNYEFKRVPGRTKPRPPSLRGEGNFGLADGNANFVIESRAKLELLCP